MTRCCNHRIVDADHRQRTDGHTFGTELVELGDALFERAAGERHAKRALLERIVERASFVTNIGRLLLEETVRARILALLVAPDAIVRFGQASFEARAGVGQCETFASA